MSKPNIILAVGLILAVVFGVCFSCDITEYETDQDVIDDETELVMDLLSVPVIPERYKSEEFMKTWNIASPINAFKWRDCGGYAANVMSLSVSPDPVKIPGEITVGIHAVVNSTMDIPIFTNLTIEKKIGDKFIKIPCIGQFGSCTYDDLCQLLEMIPECPDVLTKHGITCYCPFKTGTFNLPPSQFDAESIYLPGGDYRFIGELYDPAKKLMACLDITLSVTNG